MLEYLRNAADKPLAKFLMFILIFSFVGWGAAEWIFGGASRDTTLVRVGGEEISLQQFNNERSQQLASMSKDEQRASYTDPKKAAQLTNDVIAKLTTNQLALNRAKDLRFVVSDKRIAEEIKNHPQFQINGQFQPWMFDMVLQNSGLTEQDIANSLRAGVLRDMAMGAVNEKVAVPQFAVDAAYNARYAKRGIKYATVNFSDYKVDEPNDEQLKTYYASHPIVVPETRSVSYVFLTADNSKPDAYDAGYKKMQGIEDMIISGETMNAAADKGGAKFVAVPKITRGEKVSDKVLTDDLIAKLFSMESGSESELIELKDGFVILRVDNVVAEHDAEYKDVKKSLVSGWKKAEQRKQAYVKANEKLIALNKGESVKNMKDANVTRTEGAPLVVLNAAFAGQAGDNSIAEGNDAFYVVSVGKTVMPAPDKAKKESLRKELEKMSTRFVQDDYTRFLKQEYPVKVNERNYEKFIAK
ncbi:MAG: SurA N-terminal domain-containing protein [Alphaproteobacteria bacterium]|nr:SurA N-terminal domain-containing protein [Alphaproteobacteria bacterium]